MRTTKPLKGLLLYFWYSTGGKLTILFLQTIAWGIAFLLFGERDWGLILHFFFGMNALMGVALVVVMGMGSKEVDWERFQLSMPVRRRNMASSQFISVGLAAVVGIPIFVLFTGLSAAWHEGAYFTFLSVFSSMAPFLSMPFVLGGLLFPIYSIKAVERIYDGMFPAIMVVAMLVPVGINLGATRLGWPEAVASLLTLVVSLLIFVISYFITRKLYEKMDF